MTAIYRQKILLPDYQLSDQEKGLLHFLITSKEELKVIPINNPANENGKDPFNDNEYWQAIRDKLKQIVTITEQTIPLEAEGMQRKPEPDSDQQLKDYSFKAFQTKVGIKMTPKGFQDRLKKSPFWNKDVFPASTGQRITKIKCKPSFIEIYRRYITPNVN